MTKILLVEDDKSLREIYGVRLMAEGYEIVSAGDGEEALAVAIKERPLLILSDVMMPKISGFDMLDILRSTSETKDIKVIMMTALSSEDQRARGEALGADRYLVKSQVGIEDVVRTVHDVLGDGVAQPTPAPSFTSAPAPAPAAPAVDVVSPAPAPVAPAPAPVEPVASAPVIPEPALTVPEPIAPVTPIATPEPVAAPAPVEPVAPAPVTAPVEPSVTAPVKPAAPAPLPAPEQLSPVVPQAPAPAPAPAAAPEAPAQNPFVTPPQPGPEPVFPPHTEEPSATLPEPTAPFSTPRPASLGDRIINPLPSADSLANPNSEIADKMDLELNGTSIPPMPPQPPAAPQQ